MKVLLLSSAYNGLTQRVHVELLERKYKVSVELAISEQSMLEGVKLFKPDIIICPFLKHRVPEQIWRNHVCIIVHPGIKGDRGASSLDWAIHNHAPEWGVTALQAADEMDAGDIWATATFKMRPGTKSSIYTLEVTEAAVKVVLETLEKFQNAGFKPEPLDYNKPDVVGQLRPTMLQTERRIDWATASTDAVLTKINAADGSPGVLDDLLGGKYYLYGASLESKLRGTPGELIAQRLGAICRATTDGAVWISHLKRKVEVSDEPTFKLPAATVLGSLINNLPEVGLSIYKPQQDTFKEIGYEEKNAVGYLYFDFHNGAMSTAQCQRLQAAILEVSERPTRVLVLIGGRSAWSNGIHLNVVEAAQDPAKESWRNINAIDDLILSVLSITNKITIAAVHGNAGAGGVPLALAFDKVFVRSGVIFNPHYKGMGLYGSEYWTYSLPKRVGYEQAVAITESCMPMGMQEAKRIGLVDYVIPELFERFDIKVEILAETLAHSNNYDKLLAAKLARRNHDEFVKPLKYYREEELALMRDNFFKTTSAYHPARKNFVYKIAGTATPQHLALHRSQVEFNVDSEHNGTGLLSFKVISG